MDRATKFQLPANQLFRYAIFAYGISLVLPCVQALGSVFGLQLLLMSPINGGHMIWVWFANPLLFLAWFLLYRKDARALWCALAALVLAVGFLFDIPSLGLTGPWGLVHSNAQLLSIGALFWYASIGMTSYVALGEFRPETLAAMRSKVESLSKPPTEAVAAKPEAKPEEHGSQAQSAD